MNADPRPEGEPLRGRLFGADAVPPAGERFEQLCTFGNVMIEQILSGPDVVPAAYEQHADEWVLVLTGRASLSIGEDAFELAAGEWVLIPSGTPHRVESVDAGTQWLAVHRAPSR